MTTTEQAKVDVIINGQKTLSSLKEIEGAVKTMYAAARQATDPAMVKKYGEEWQRLKEIQAKHIEAIKGSESALRKLKNTIGEFGAAAGIAFSVGAIIDFGKSMFNSFAEAEKSALKLKIAVGVNGGLAGDVADLVAQAKELELQSIFSDETIQDTQTMALQFGLTARQVKELLPIVTDFASATGQDLSGALEAVLRGLEGNGKGLKLYGIEIDSTKTKAELLADITQKLTEKFKGQSEMIAGTAVGQIEQAKNAWDNLKETFLGLAVVFERLSRLNPFYNVSAHTQEVIKEQAEKDISAQKKYGEIIQKLTLDQLNERNRTVISLIKQAASDGDKQREHVHKLQLQVIQSRLTELQTLYDQAHDKDKDKTSTHENKKTQIIKQASEDRGKIEMEQDLQNLETWNTKQKIETAELRADGAISEDEYQKRLLDIQKKYLILKIFNLKQYGKQTEDLELQLLENTIKSNDKATKDFKDSLKDKRKELEFETSALATLMMTGVSITGESYEQMVNHIKNLNDGLTKGTKKTFKEIMGDIAKGISMFGGQLSNIFSSLNKVSENKANAWLEHQKKVYEKDKDYFKFQLDHKLITQVQFDAKMKAVDEKAEKDARKVAHENAIRNKKLSYFNSLIHTAEGVANALTLPWPLNLIMATIVGAAGAAEIAAISSAPIPELGKGKKFSGSGKHPNSSQFVSDASGNIFNVEDGEVLLSANTAEKNPIVDDLLNASLNNNGSLPSIENEFPAVNARRVSETSQLLRGNGISSSTGNSTNPQDGSIVINSSANSSANTNNTDLLAILMKLNAHLDNGIVANLGYTNFKKDLKRLDSITGQK